MGFLLTENLPSAPGGKYIKIYAWM